MTPRAPGVLDDAEMRGIVDRFGVGEAQVRRDHVISHVLAALSTLETEGIVFFGGTALARTHLPSGRLSEDVDLIALGSRADTAKEISRVLSRSLRKSVGTRSPRPWRWAPYACRSN